MEKLKKFTQTKSLVEKKLHKNSVIYDIFLKTDIVINSIFIMAYLSKMTGESHCCTHC